MPPAPASQTEKLHEILRACALEYDAGAGGAPKVKWYAEGEAAERMLAIARRHGVRIEPNQEEALLLALKSVRINSEIPETIYLAMARIYAYFLQQEKK